MTLDEARAIASTIKIGDAASVRVDGQERWVVLHVADGSGARTTVSLTVSQALDLSALLKGCAVTAAGVNR